MATKTKDEEKDSFNPTEKIETKKDIPPIAKVPSLSNYREPGLMPMREKEILSKKDQKAKELLVNDARKHNVSLDIGDAKGFNYGKTINPSTTNEKKDNTAESIKNLQSTDLNVKAKGYSDLQAKAPQQELPKLDSKQLMDDAKKQRRSKLGDKLQAFGTALQGGTYDWDNSNTAKYQRKRDAQFQEYKDIAANNKKVKNAWDSKNREDLINFLETEMKTRDLNEKEQAKLEEAKFIKDRDFALKSETEQAKIKGGYYNRSKSTAKSTTPKINLPFESENVINEMNLMTGGASAAKSSRNQQRLSDLVSANPKALETLSDLSEKAATIRSQIDKQDKLRLKSLKDGLSAEAEGYAAEIAKMNKELTQYQNDIKSILNGKTPEAKQETAPETTKTQQPKKISAKEYIDSL